jgi:hypothetical protein
MPSQTYGDAVSARDQLMNHLSWRVRRRLNGTALEKLASGGWGVVVMLERSPRRPLPLPSEVAGVPVRITTTGPTRAVTSVT